ncbi:alpha-mannosidase [Cutibacterium acnes JCM 18920]|nr:alpha-mannosidase [Cutibacterium acnes JCM 18920]
MIVDLGGVWDSPGFQSEGLVVRPDGSIIKALNPRNTWIPVETDAEGHIDVYVEAASNPILLAQPPFQPTEDGDKLTASTDTYYSLKRADLVLVNDEVRELIADIVTLSGLADQLPEDSERHWDVRRALDRAMDRLDLFDVISSASAARSELAPALTRPAHDSAQTMTAIGHAHIDSAWLWPLRETRRKVARTISNQLNLIDTDPATSLPSQPLSIRPGSKRIILISSPGCRRLSRMVASSRSAVCGWSPMPTFPGASRCAGSCCTDSAISWRNSATIVPKCGCPTLLATPAHYPNSPNWPVPAGF